MAVYSGPKIANNGLVLHLDAANPKSYPGSGTIWNDLTINKRQISSSGLTYNTNQGGALNMPTGGELLTIVPTTEQANILASQDFSIETVVKSTNVVYPRSRHPLYVNDTVTAATTKGWSAGHASTATQIEIRACDGVNLANGYIQHSVQEATTYHRVFTISRASGLLTTYYVNGVQIGQVNAPSVTGTIYSSGNIVFGNVWGWRFIGDIYLIKVYNRVLSLAEIQQNYEALRGRYGI